MMAPRFANPHSLSIPLTVSRTDLSLENESRNDNLPQKSNGDLIKELNRSIQASLDYRASEEPCAKRRRVDLVLDPLEYGSPIFYRLVSNSLPPYPLLLEPKPPPPPITREPNSEDSATQAKRRRKQAKAAAVEPAWIQYLSQQLSDASPRSQRKQSILCTAATMPRPAPLMMIIEIDQPLRKTRPPVPLSELQHHPYKAEAPIPLTNASRSTMDCPVIHASPHPSISPSNKGSRKRRRGKMAKQERLQPAFWRPNPMGGGKGMGYAMGYPCSIEVFDAGESSYYPRDTMRNGVHA